MELDRKQDLNVLYQVCVFQADQKTKLAAPAYDWDILDFSETADGNLTKLDRKQDLNVGLIKKTRRPPRLIYQERRHIVLGCICGRLGPLYVVKWLIYIQFA